VRLEGLSKLKRFIHLIEPWSRDLSACSILSQPLRYRVPKFSRYFSWERKENCISMWYWELFLTSFNFVKGYLRIVQVIRANVQLVTDISFDETFKTREVTHCTVTVIVPTYGIKATDRINRNGNEDWQWSFKSGRNRIRITYEI
jgi:hypothetical protein